MHSNIFCCVSNMGSDIVAAVTFHEMRCGSKKKENGKKKMENGHWATFLLGYRVRSAPCLANSLMMMRFIIILVVG